MLVYCYSNFCFDREALRISNAVFLDGTFERQSRLTTDPSQIFLFRMSFDSLRILTITDFLLRFDVNLPFCNRFKRVVGVHIGRKRRAMFNRHQRSFSLLLDGEELVPKLAALPFALFAVLVLVSTHKSIATSVAACAMDLQCVVYAKRWHTGNVCPYLTLIDMDKGPKTYDEWMIPVDDTELVRQLAKSGGLRVIQLISRRLRMPPDELHQHAPHVREHSYTGLTRDAH